jgi:hypothetical protein
MRLGACQTPKNISQPPTKLFTRKKPILYPIHCIKIGSDANFLCHRDKSSLSPMFAAGDWRTDDLKSCQNKKKYRI